MIYDVLCIQGLVFLQFCSAVTFAEVAVRASMSALKIKIKMQEVFAVHMQFFFVCFCFIGAQTDAAHDLSLNAKPLSRAVTVCIFNCCKTFVFILVNVQSDV